MKKNKIYKLLYLLGVAFVFFASWWSDQLGHLPTFQFALKAVAYLLSVFLILIGLTALARYFFKI